MTAYRLPLIVLPCAVGLLSALLTGCPKFVTGLECAVESAAFSLGLEASAASIAYGTEMTATATASAAVDSYAWYIDNQVVEGQEGPSFAGGSSLAPGRSYTLMVVVEKDGTLHSESVSFKVAG